MRGLAQKRDVGYRHDDKVNEGGKADWAVNRVFSNQSQEEEGKKLTAKLIEQTAQRSI